MQNSHLKVVNPRNIAGERNKKKKKKKKIVKNLKLHLPVRSLLYDPLIDGNWGTL